MKLNEFQCVAIRVLDSVANDPKAPYPKQDS